MPALRSSLAASPPLAVCAACFLVGCLRPGGPPAGRHLIADRSLGDVFLLPAEAEDAPPRVLVTGPSREAPADSRYAGQKLADLYAFVDGSLSSPSHLPEVEPLVVGIAIPSSPPVDYEIPQDRMGRLLIVQPGSGTEQEFSLWRFDLAAGSATPVAAVDVPAADQAVIFSADRARAVARNGESATVVDLDGSRYLPGAACAVFIGEDLYCATSPTDGIAATTGFSVMRLRPAAEPELLLPSSGRLGIAPIIGDWVPQLLVSLRSDAGDSPFALLDTETLRTTVLPEEKGAARFVSASPDGHWLLFQANTFDTDPAGREGQQIFLLYDWTTGQIVSIDSADVSRACGDRPASSVVRSGSSSEWRPGTTELWFLAPCGFAIWSPTRGLVAVNQWLHTLILLPEGKPTWFSRSGRYWLGAGTTLADLRGARVGQADDPEHSALAVTSSPTWTFWEAEDGRLLFEASPADHDRSDIFLVDPTTNEVHALAGAGHLVALGRHRALALLDWQVSLGTGILALVDLVDGTRTALAESVYAVAVAPGTPAVSTDRLAPGRRIAFLSRSRLASPYDGLWVAELP